MTLQDWNMWCMNTHMIIRQGVQSSSTHLERIQTVAKIVRIISMESHILRRRVRSQDTWLCLQSASISERSNPEVSTTDPPLVKKSFCTWLDILFVHNNLSWILPKPLRLMWFQGNYYSSLSTDSQTQMHSFRLLLPDTAVVSFNDRTIS